MYKKFLIVLMLIYNICGNDLWTLKAQGLSSTFCKGVSVSEQRIIEFAGCNWYVKAGYGGPGPNYWSDDEKSIWVDENGRLHLKVRQIDNTWYCAEVYTQQCTQYGEHRFLIDGKVDQMDKNVVLGLFVYADDLNEIDIEFSKWGYANNVNVGGFTIQPYTTPGNTVSFPINLDTTTSTHYFNWQPDSISFASINGHHVDIPPSQDLYLCRWIYTGNDIPNSLNRLHTRINLWLFRGVAPASDQNLEIIITDVIQPIIQNAQVGRDKSPERYILAQNYPNPFNQATTISFILQRSDFISIDILNCLGQKVRTVANSFYSADRHDVCFNARYLSSGIYYYQIKGKDFIQTKKMILIK